MNLDSLDNNGNNIIHKLLKNNNLKKLKETLEILIERGDLKKLITQKNYIGYTPLQYSIINQNQEGAQILINNGADINTITDNGYYVKKLGAKLNKDSNKIVGIRFI
jgi:ankyrin repeat protein